MLRSVATRKKQLSGSPVPFAGPVWRCGSNGLFAGSSLVITATSLLGEHPNPAISGHLKTGHYG